MSQDRRADQEPAAHVRAGHISVFLEVFQVLLVQRIDQLPSPQTAIPVKQLERGVQDVMRSELLGQLVAALGQSEALLVSAFEVHEAQPEPEKTQRPVAAGGDAVD